MRKRKKFPSPTGGLFNLTELLSAVRIEKPKKTKFPSPTGDYLI